jgi:uncharacterized protein YjbJ (UPF0337 family)
MFRISELRRRDRVHTICSKQTWFCLLLRNLKHGGLIMDWNRIEGNWKEFKGKAKVQWGKLTDDDLDVVKGHREQLEGRIQQAYGYEKDKARTEVDAWLKNLN